MEPITIVGAVSAATDLAVMTLKLGLQLYRFYCEVKSAPKKSKELCDEISELSFVMNDLAQTLKEVEENPDIVIVNIISVDSLQKYSQFLSDLSSCVQVDKKEIKKRLKWPLSTKDNEELIAKLERYKATMTLALQSAVLKLGSAHEYFSSYIRVTIDTCLNRSLSI